MPATRPSLTRPSFTRNGATIWTTSRTGRQNVWPKRTEREAKAAADRLIAAGYVEATR